MAQYTLESTLPVAPETAFAWFIRAGTFRRLLPPWQHVTLAAPPPPLGPGVQVRCRVRHGPLAWGWTAAVREVAPVQRRFVQDLRGPLVGWRHALSCLPGDAGQTLLRDEVDYRPPPLSGPLGDTLMGWHLGRLLRFRARRAGQDLQRHARHAAAGSWRIAISGASGLVGRALRDYLDGAGHSVLPLLRGVVPGRTGTIGWNPHRGEIDAAALDGLHAVVHLAGASIAGGRWTPARKAEIRDSRVGTTRLLAETLARLPHPPRVLVCASAVGFYGDRGSQPVDESAGPGQGFLAEVCRAWEAAAEPAREAGIRVVHLRFGVILAPGGGALAAMLPPFRLGLGGPVGHGRQGMPWVALEDALGAIEHTLFSTALAGPVNVVAPQAASNRDFARALGAALNRPAVLPLPAFAVRALLGEMGRELLLGGATVRPARLQAAGFEFLYPALPGALAAALGRE